MEGVVDNTPLTNTNYLTLNRVYRKVGSTDVVAAEPSVVHFGGFEVGGVYKQTLRIVNRHGAGTRVHILPPTTPFFKASCDDKRGLIAPGLNEEIEIEFRPQQYKVCGEERSA